MRPAATSRVDDHGKAVPKTDDELCQVSLFRTRSLARTCVVMVMASVLYLLGSPESVRGETMLAVGSLYAPDARGEVASKPLVLRLAAESGWSLVPLDTVLDAGALMTATMVGENAFAFGVRAGGPLILKSNDAGQTWVDVTGSFEYYAPGQTPLAGIFSDDQVGWVVAQVGFGSGPNLFVTEDGGGSWRLAGEGGPLVARGIFGLRLVGAGVQVAASGPTGTSLRTFDGLQLRVEPGEGTHLRAAAFAASGDRWWAVGREGWTPDGGPDVATIQSSVPGQPWGGTRIELGERVDLNSIKFCDPAHGVVGGSVVLGGRDPDALLLTTADGGGAWRQVDLPSGLGPSRIGGLGCVDPESVWAAVNRVGEAGSMLLHSTDRGSSWAQIPSMVETNGRIRAFTHN